MITGKLYDYLKWACQVVLPAVGALYVALAGLWGLPSPEEVAGTILAVVTFLGVILGISQVSYKKNVSEGIMYVNEGEEKTTFRLAVDDVDVLPGMQEARFRIKPELSRPEEVTK